MTAPQDLIERVKQQSGLHDKMAQSHLKLRRGMVWCRNCGRSQLVDSANALAAGWPKCCGFTMTIDAPDERVLSSALQSSEQQSK